MWSGGKKRWLGQRESCGSVVWWEKALVGSKRKSSECGLVGKSAGWVKGKASKCGLVGKSDGWVKGKAVGVWSGKGKLPPGSKRKPSECGLTRKNAAWVKEEATEVWSDKKKRRLGQRGSHRSVV